MLLVVSCLLFGPNNRQLTTNNSKCTEICTIARIPMHLHDNISLHIFSKYRAYELSSIHYIAAYGQHDDIYFVDLSSVVITEQEKQFYTVAANVLQYRPAADEVLNTYTRYILFDTKKDISIPSMKGKQT